MARFDASNAECLVYSFKDGILAKLAHDLKIRIERFQIDVDDEDRSIVATFDATSLSVVCARKDGRDDPGTLSKGDMKKIHANVADDVLAVKKHPEVRFESTEVTEQGDGFHIVGNLTLHGRTRSIAADIRKQGNEHVTEVTLHQPDYGIKPYTAALGALKVQPDVKVEVRVPAN